MVEIFMLTETKVKQRMRNFAKKQQHYDHINRKRPCRPGI
jgi:hypothetical protein